jgi:hypothetical protein
MSDAFIPYAQDCLGGAGSGKGGRGVPFWGSMSLGGWPVLIALGLVLVTFQGARGFEISNPLADPTKLVPDLNPFDPRGGIKPPSGVPDPRKKVQDLFATCKQLTNEAQEALEKANRVRMVLREAASSAQGVVLYEFDAKASFTYDAYTGTAWYEFVLPKGIKAEKDKVKVESRR